MLPYAKRTERTMYPGWLLNYLKQQGVTKFDVAEGSGLDVERYYDVQEVMPLDDYLFLFSWTAERLNEPHLGLVLAEQATPDDFGLFGFLTSSSETLGDMWTLFDRYQKILMQGATLEFIQHEELIEAKYCISSNHQAGLIQDVEFSLASIVSMIRKSHLEEWTPVKTTFAHAPVLPVSDYESTFGGDVSFNKISNSMWFEKEIWTTPLPTANLTLFSVLKEQANRLVEEVDGDEGFLSKVRFLIGSRLGDDSFSIESLAHELNMSSRTLHRRLREENTTFKDLKLELMMSVAKETLLDGDVSIADLAQTLGYSESSAFVRVFKRLQGVSPLQFRKQNID